MKKSDVLLQLSENVRANDIFNRAISELEKIRWSDRKSRRLRSCSAEVYETENFYILLSYRTYIAAIEKSSDTLADVLRTEYGYTSTSAQHISKFSREYGAGSWGCAHVIRSLDLSNDDLAKIYYVKDDVNGNLLTIKEARKAFKAEELPGSVWSWYTVTEYPLDDELETAAVPA